MLGLLSLFSICDQPFRWKSTEPSTGQQKQPAAGRRASRGRTKGSRRLQKAAVATTGGVKAQRGDARLGSPRYSKPHLPALRVSLLFLLLSLQQASGGVQLLAISQPVSPPRQPAGEPRLITCQETSRCLSASLQRDFATPSQATFPAATKPRCLPSLWLPPRPLLKPLQSRDVRAIESKTLQSRGNNSAGVIGDMSSSALFLLKLSAPARPDVPGRAALTLGKGSSSESTAKPDKRAFLKWHQRHEAFWQINDFHSFW